MKEKLEDILSRGDSGVLMNDANEQLQEVVKAVLDNGGKGSVTLKINIARVKNEAIEIVPELTSKIPAPSRMPDLYFGDAANGDVSRKHPGQPDLPNTDTKEHVDEDGVVTILSDHKN